MKNQPNPKITIVTICYNCKDELEETLKSVVSQTYPNKEYIIIDGRSTDGTRELLASYEKYFAKYISEPDHGIYDAMNKGLRLASGEWIIFMNAGDSFHSPTTLQEAAAFLSNDLYMVYGDTLYIRSNGRQVEKAQNEEYIRRNMPTSHQSFIVKTEKAREIGFNEKYKFAADYNMIYNIFMKYGIEHVKHIPLTISNYEAIEGLTMHHCNEVFHEVLKIRHWSLDKCLGYVRYYIKRIIGRA